MIVESGHCGAVSNRPHRFGCSSSSGQLATLPLSVLHAQLRAWQPCGPALGPLQTMVPCYSETIMCAQWRARGCDRGAGRGGGWPPSASMSSPRRPATPLRGAKQATVDPCLAVTRNMLVPWIPGASFGHALLRLPVDQMSNDHQQPSPQLRPPKPRHAHHSSVSPRQWGARGLGHTASTFPCKVQRITTHMCPQRHSSDLDWTITSILHTCQCTFQTASSGGDVAFG